MKRLMGIASLLVLAACGSNQGNGKATTDTTASPAEHQMTDTGSASANAGTEHTTYPGYGIMLQQDCKTCHTPDKISTGPSFMIAARYDSTKAGTVEHLAEKVISGGKGSFGDVPMTPHPSLSKADAEELVKYILSYKN